MKTIWHKVWSDLWDNKVRTGLAVLSIAAGVFAVGTTFSLSDQLLGGMDEAHQAINPSHINVALSQGIDQNAVNALKRMDGVADIEPFNQIATRYKLDPEDSWQSALLAARADYEDQKFDVLDLKAGEWPQKDYVASERLSASYLGLEPGDEVILEISRGKVHQFPVDGVIRYHFAGPPEFGAPAMFFTDSQGMERFDIPRGTYQNLLIQVDPYTEEHSRQVASDIKNQLAKMNVGVGATFYQDPETHWGRSTVDGINMVLQLLAGVSLLMSVVLVLNTLTALITQQTNQIGIIKAIGGKRGTILKIYLTGVLVYGILSLFIALPLGIFMSNALTQWMLNMFNIDCANMQISSQAVVVQVLAALAVPALAALPPILKGANITVREAIASYGLGGDFGSSWMDRAVERTAGRFLPSSFAIALANLIRRKGRLILTLLVLITAGTMFLIVMSLSSSVTLTLEKDIARRNYDTSIQFQDRQRVERTQAMAETNPEVAATEMWFNQRASILLAGQGSKEAGISTVLVGIPPDSDMYQPQVVAGRWLLPEDGRSVVITKDMAKDYDIQVGDEITLNLGELVEDDWTVVGLYVTISSFGFDSAQIFAPREALWQASKKHNQGNDLQVRTVTHGPETANRVTEELKTLFTSRNMKLDYTETVYEAKEAAESQFSIFIYMLMALAVIVALVGGIGLMGSLSISVVERTREIGVMRAIGAQTGVITSMFLMEGILQGILSWAVAVPLSFLLAQPAAVGLGEVMFGTTLDFQYNWLSVLLWLVIIVVIAGLSSILPARNATHISVQESLAYL